MLNSSIWFIDRTLSGVTTSDKNGPVKDDNDGVPCIPQSSSIIGASPSDSLVPYPGHTLRESYLLAEIQLVYSTASADWARTVWELLILHRNTWNYTIVYK